MSSRIQYRSHKGQRILYCDFSHILDPAEGIRHIEVADREVSKAEPNSLLVLINIEGSRIDKRLMQAVGESAKFQKPYTRACALTGVSGFHRALYSFVARIAGRREPMFPNVESALDWLAAQAQGLPARV